MAVEMIGIIAVLLAVLILLCLLVAYICFRMAFYVSDKNRAEQDGFGLPPGEIYEPYYDLMRAWNREVEALAYKECAIRSFDGLTLKGRYYQYAPGAPIELMFHGYRGSAQRDLCGGVQRCFALGRNVLIVDQRAAGQSEGKVISFGVNESRDCLAWVDFLIDTFGADVKIILTGISMGASTVMMAAARPLPPNVVGILADCGYSSARDIIKKTIREMKLPADLLFPFVKLGARLYGGFDLEELTPLDGMKNCTVPVIFFHGDGDDYVPHAMSRQAFDACIAPKKLVLIPGAGHGLSYPAAPERYLHTLAEFFTQNGLDTTVIQ